MNARSAMSRGLAAFGATLLSGLAALTGAATAGAQDTGANTALAEFAGCMAGEGSADLLLVLDQSGSLTTSDPEGQRVDAARDFVEELAKYGEESNTDIRVRTAGFGTSFYGDQAEYGSWMSLSEGTEPVGEQLEKFRERVNDDYTEYPAALRGSLATMQTGESPCSAVMLFSDGEMTMESGDIPGAAAQMCSPSGEVAQLRHAGVRVFTIGLDAEGTQDLSLFQGISESPECGAPGQPNGQFFFGNSPASLLAAFRSAIPNPAGMGREGIPVAEEFSFYLDNSITPVSLSAQPESVVEGLTPVLIPPGGEAVEIVPGTQRIGGAEVGAVFSETVPGAVDIDMTLAEDWAGEWRFGYRTAGETDASYRAQLTIRPGMSIAVDTAEEQAEGPLRSVNTQPLQFSLQAPDGTPVALDGEATLSVYYRTPAGELVLLENGDISTGQPLPVSLEQVTQPTSGALVAVAQITTAAPGGQPGTRLNPLVYERGMSVTLENLPQPPSAISLGALSEESVTVEAPVAGPGLLWVETGDWQGADLPEGTTATVDSSANSPETAVALDRGETGTLPVTFTLSELVDGPLNGDITVHFAELDGSNPSSTTVPVSGAMSVPIDTTVFTATLIIVLLLALAIPLAILYLMKYLSGRIPTTPKITSTRVPLARQGSTLVNSASGTPFALDHAEIIAGGPARMNAHSASVQGVNLSVKLGANPFTPVHVIAEHPLSVAADGAQAGTSAKLPLAIQNQWFVIMNPHNAQDVSVIVMLDVLAQSARLEEIQRDIERQAPDLIEQLASQRDAQAPAESGGGADSASGGSAGAPAAPAPQSNGPFGTSPGSGPSGQGAPFGDQNSGNQNSGGPSGGPFGDQGNNPFGGGNAGGGGGGAGGPFGTR